MPHQRHRILYEPLLKRWKLWPAIGIVGARQTGKSTLLKRLIETKKNARYVTLDSFREIQRAKRSPDSFSSPYERSIAIDEIQKVPQLFDSIKMHIDKARVPSTFLLSGSTEFSEKVGIRESLTGRIAMVQLFPLIGKELFEIPELGKCLLKPGTFKAVLTLEEYEKKINRGGMPGMCFLRSDGEFEDLCREWLETTCFRDLPKVCKFHVDGHLALEILSWIAQLSEPTASNIAKKLRKDTRTIIKYLDAFQIIFVITELKPHSTGVGKSEYVLLDSGVTSYFGGTRENTLRTNILNEVRALAEANSVGKPGLYYFRNEKTSRVPIILDWVKAKRSAVSIAIHFFEGEDPSRGDFECLNTFRKRGNHTTRTLLLTHTSESYTEGQVEVHSLRSF